MLQNLKLKLVMSLLPMIIERVTPALRKLAADWAVNVLWPRARETPRAVDDLLPLFLMSILQAAPEGMTVRDCFVESWIAAKASEGTTDDLAVQALAGLVGVELS